VVLFCLLGLIPSHFLRPLRSPSRLLRWHVVADLPFRMLGLCVGHVDLTRGVLSIRKKRVAWPDPNGEAHRIADDSGVSTRVANLPTSTICTRRLVASRGQSFNLQTAFRGSVSLNAAGFTIFDPDELAPIVCLHNLRRGGRDSE
jgi:hypothetical protein